MVYIKGPLSVVTSLFLVLYLPGLVNAFRGLIQEKATGFAVVGAGLQEALRSPLIWIVAITLSALFLAVSRIDSKPLRVLLFWIPTVSASALAVLMTAFGTYLYFHLRHG